MILCIGRVYICKRIGDFEGVVSAAFEQILG